MSFTRESAFCLLLVFALSAPASAANLPPGFSEKLIASGLSNPTAMAMAPDGRIFVCEQGGKVRVIANGQLLAQPFVQVTVNDSGERGLLGIAFDPAFANNHWVYLYYTVPNPVHNRVSRFTANGNRAVAGSEVQLLNISPLTTATNHNGGALHFGEDGKLYVAVGENADGANAQTLSNLKGKILRLNKNGSVPTDNPFYNQASGINRAIWAWGLRNPFTFAIQPGSGRMFINDVGANSWEEINLGVAGGNYGWPDTEGDHNNPNYERPLHAYPHNSSGGCAIAGGAFYNPDSPHFPSSFVGKYFFADLCSGWIRVLNPSNNAVSGFATNLSNPVDLLVAPDGRLYYLQRGGGRLYRITHGTAQQTGDGLTGTYFNNRDFTGTTFKRIDPTVNFNWAGSPGEPIAPDTFSVRWTGLVHAEFTETYTFYTRSNDGVRLWVNGKPLVNNWTQHSLTENKGTISLVKGQKYTIKMEFFDQAGVANAVLLWSSPSTPKKVIPKGRLYSVP